MREVNYNPADSALYSSKYSIEEIRIGLVTDETMTLHRGKLKVPNPALKDVLYKLDSSLLNLDSVAIENPLVTILDQ